jgi:hypothetical protein
MTPALDMLADLNERRVREGLAVDMLRDWSEERVRDGLAALHEALKKLKKEESKLSEGALHE